MQTFAYTFLIYNNQPNYTISTCYMDGTLVVSVLFLKSPTFPIDIQRVTSTSPTPRELNHEG